MFLNIQSSTLILICCIWSCYCSKLDAQELTIFDFDRPVQEYNAFQFFDKDASGVDPINTFLLAKMSEMMYLERLDYQLRYLHNGRQAVDSIPYSDWIKERAMISDDNFEQAFQQRFQHYFFKQEDIPKWEIYLSKAEDPAISNTASLYDRFVEDSINWSATHLPKFHYIHKTEYLDGKSHKGLDPELMVISTEELIIIAFRGTDMVEGKTWSEWIGTDFNIRLVRGGGSLMGTRIHKGFWQSFDLVRDELLRHLDAAAAQKKKIWLTGHSLGGAMAILAGTYLKSKDYPVQNIYAFAAPRVVGDKKFTRKIDELLPNCVQRFEYYLDPISMFWAPRYRKAGQRNWFDDEEYGQYRLYVDAKERYMHFWPFHFNRHPFGDQRKIEKMRVQREMNDGLITNLPFRFWYHNPQWYVKAAYAQLSAEQKALLPAVDDSFPYLYSSAKGPMPGTK